MGPNHILTPLLFFTSFLLLLLVTLSVPIIKSIYLFRIGADVSVGTGSFFSASAQSAVDFGVFGWCSLPIVLKESVLTQKEPARCSGKHLGYTINPTIEQILNTIDAKDLVDVIDKALTIVLVLHPIACGLTFIALLFTLYTSLRPQSQSSSGRISYAIASGSGILAATLTSLIFIIDLIFAAIVKSKIHKDTSGKAYASYGNAEWLVLVAAILLWIATAGACWGLIRGRKARDAGRY